MIYLIGFVVFFVLIHQFVHFYCSFRYSEHQSAAIEMLEGNPCVLGRVIGDLGKTHVFRTEEGWTVFNGPEVFVLPEFAKKSLIHRWKQKKLECLAEQIYKGGK